MRDFTECESEREKEGCEREKKRDKGKTDVCAVFIDSFSHVQCPPGFIDGTDPYILCSPCPSGTFAAAGVFV